MVAELGSSIAGLSSTEAEARAVRWGANVLHPREQHPSLRLLGTQLRSPIAILLALTAVVSALVGEVVDAIAAITLALPYLPGIAVLGFAPLPPALLAALVGVTTLLVLASEAAKWLFFARHPLGGGSPRTLDGHVALLDDSSHRRLL